jgi:hypothetical protein
MTEETKTRTAFTKDERGILNNWAIEPKMYYEDTVEKKSTKKVKEQVANQSQDQSNKEQSEALFGITEYAELLNGRLAMIGITLLVIVEVVTGKGFLQIIGF